MCIRDRLKGVPEGARVVPFLNKVDSAARLDAARTAARLMPVSYTHLRAHETVLISYAVFCLKKKNRPNRYDDDKVD